MGPLEVSTFKRGAAKPHVPLVGLKGPRQLRDSPPGRNRDLAVGAQKKNQPGCRVSSPWLRLAHCNSACDFVQDSSPTMAPKHSATAASVKRKASSSEKHSDGNRAKKPKTFTAAPKRQNFDDDEEMGSGGDGSAFSDSADGGAELKHAKPSRGQGKPWENGKAAGAPANQSMLLSPFDDIREIAVLTLSQPRPPAKRTQSRSSWRTSARLQSHWLTRCTGRRSCGRSCAGSRTCPRRSASSLSTSCTA